MPSAVHGDGAELAGEGHAALGDVHARVLVNLLGPTEDESHLWFLSEKFFISVVIVVDLIRLSAVKANPTRGGVLLVGFVFVFLGGQCGIRTHDGRLPSHCRFSRPVHYRSANCPSQVGRGVSVLFWSPVPWPNGSPH